MRKISSGVTGAKREIIFSEVLWVFDFCVGLDFLEKWEILGREVRSEEGEIKTEVGSKV